jgi:hypothetical protein
MSIKKLALDLVVKISSPNISLEELDQALKDAKKSMVELGDDGSEEFKKLNTVVQDAEGSINSAAESMSGFNGEAKKTNKSLDETGEAQKKASKGSDVLKTGIKGVGLAFKAMGIGIVVAALKFFFDALKSNQRVVDAFAKVTGTISIVMKEVVAAVISAVDQVSKASQGFDGLKKVISGLLTVAMTPLKLSFYQIKLALEVAQLAWESSFFGGGDEEKIKELRLGIEDTSLAIKETAVDAVQAGKDIVNNLGKAASEIGGVVGEVVDGISDISIKAAASQSDANVDLQKNAMLAAATQQLLLEKADIAAEKQRQIRDDERISIDDRKAANEELGKVLDDQEKAMLAVADAQIAAAKINNEINGTTESEIELINALANKQGVLAQIEGFRSEQKVNAATLDREQLTLNSTLGDSEAKLAYDRKVFDAEQISDKIKSLQELQRLAEEEQQTEMLRLETKVEATKSGTQAEADALAELYQYRETSRQEDIERQKEILETSVKLNKEADDKIAADDKKSREQNQQVLDAKLQAASGMFNALSGLATAFAKGDEESQRKAFKINKAFGIGQALISTAVGVTNALTAGGNPLKLATGAQFVEAAAVGVAGAAQIATIAKTQFNGGANSITQPNAFGGGGMNGLQPTPFSSPNVNTQQQPTRVIVTETDITNTVNGVDGIYRRAVVVQ